MRSRAAQGYLLVAGSFLIFGFIGVLVDWATAPESALLAIRFVTAGLVLGAVFARSRPFAGALTRAVWPRLLVMGVVDSAMLLLFFVAIRGTSVAGDVAGAGAVRACGRGGSSRARAGDANVLCIRYAADGRGVCGCASRAAHRRHPAVTILCIYERLWPDPG